MDNVVVEIKNLSKLYRLGKNDVYALQGIDLKIHRGEFVALAGESGSGKTTLLNLIGCLDEPTDGNLQVLGQNVSTAGEKELAALRASKLGFVFQNFNLVPVLSAIENVEYSLIASAITDSERITRSRAALDRVGLGDRVSHRPDELSGGQRQRVAIARAIVHRPVLIIADEPTAALDKKNASAILQLLQELRKELEVTVVLASHDPLVLSQADRVVQLSDGVVIRDEKQGAT